MVGVMAEMKTVSLVNYAIRKVRIDNQADLEVALSLFRDDLLGLIARVERFEQRIAQFEQRIERLEVPF